MRKLLEEMLGSKVAGIIKSQIGNGVGPVPAGQALKVVEEFNKTDIDTLRGVMFITVNEDLAKGGVAINTGFAGTQQLLDALMELQAVRLTGLEDHPDVVHIPPEDERCEHCGDVNEPTDHFDNVDLGDLLNFGRGPRRTGEKFDPALGLLAARSSAR